jgi:hypothetical protein
LTVARIDGFGAQPEFPRVVDAIRMALSADQKVLVVLPCPKQSRAWPSGAICLVLRYTAYGILTDLARANWDIHEIATFAGHRSVQTTTVYVHLSGRDLANKLARGMAEIHAGRVAAMGEVLA